MINKIRKIWQPALYHGLARTRPFFEGWYYKIVNRPANRILAIIPGIFLARTAGESQAFIQVADREQKSVTFHSFHESKFGTSENPFRLFLNGNMFALTELCLNLEQGDSFLKGRLQFNNLRPWPVKLLSPGVMGPYAFAPFMQCYHAVLSFDHVINGSLNINGDIIDFSGGRGYIEKDWGNAFPKAYFWLQCNHFQKSTGSLFLSIARVPWVTGAFRGFLCGLQFGDEFYRFTTYNGSKIERFSIGEQKIEVILNNGLQRLELNIKRAESLSLYAPYGGRFIGGAMETLNASLTARLYKRRDGRFQLKWEDFGYPAAVDVNGNLNLITE